MERAPERAGGRPAEEHLGQLAETLRGFRQLTVSMQAGGNGVVALDVTGPAGRARIVAGSIHYWWGAGDGPIGPIDQADSPLSRSPRGAAQPGACLNSGETPPVRSALGNQKAPRTASQRADLTAPPTTTA
jgi:hypothetical protein